MTKSGRKRFQHVPTLPSGTYPSEVLMDGDTTLTIGSVSFGNRHKDKKVAIIETMREADSTEKGWSYVLTKQQIADYYRRKRTHRRIFRSSMSRQDLVEEE